MELRYGFLPEVVWSLNRRVVIKTRIAMTNLETSRFYQTAGLATHSGGGRLHGASGPPFRREIGTRLPT